MCGLPKREKNVPTHPSNRSQHIQTLFWEVAASFSSHSHPNLKNHGSGNGDESSFIELGSTFLYKEGSSYSFHYLHLFYFSQTWLNLLVSILQANYVTHSTELAPPSAFSSQNSLTYTKETISNEESKINPFIVFHY